MFSWTGSRGSFLGDINMYGKGGVQFFTQLKTVTSNWRYDEARTSGRAAPAMPTMR